MRIRNQTVRKLAAKHYVAATELLSHIVHLQDQVVIELKLIMTFTAKEKTYAFAVFLPLCLQFLRISLFFVLYLKEAIFPLRIKVNVMLRHKLTIFRAGV